MKIDVPYGIATRLKSTSPAGARARVIDALQKEGFGVLTEIDMQATLKAKAGAQIDPYVILGACNPHLALRALREDPGIGLLLPCNVVLSADGKDVIVAAASPRAMFAVAKATAAVEAIATEAEDKLRRAIAAC
jgi:uncharacterized protein (DUF302 family)